jgi:hypothetical protein
LKNRIAQKMAGKTPAGVLTIKFSWQFALNKDTNKITALLNAQAAVGIIGSELWQQSDFFL